MAKVQSAAGPSLRYVVQLLLYARGYRNLGFPVERVALVALPRTAPTLDQAYVWERPCTPDDDLIVSAVMSLTEYRAHLAREVLGVSLDIEDVPRTPSDDCAFCTQFRPEAAREILETGRQNGPGCPRHSLPY